MEYKLTNDADALICVLYKEYLQRRKHSINKAEAQTFRSSESIHKSHMSKWSYEDVDETCKELSREGLLNCGYADNVVLSSQLSDSAIVYMENRFKKGLSEILDYIDKIAGIIKP